MPSILFINRVYPPQSGATGRVLEYIAQGFVAAGWQVSVLTTAGDHSLAGEELREGVKVIRVASGFSKRSLLARALGYALMIPSLFLRALLLPRADVVVTKTDPPMLLAIGPLLKFLKGSRLIHWAQDLYPEVAEELGVFPKGGAVAGVIRALSTRSIQGHDAVVPVGRCMADLLVQRGIAPDKIRVILNTGVEQEIIPVPREKNSFRSLHGLKESFVVEYSGNLGRAHEFATVLEAARLLQSRGESDILFLFIGGGPGEEALRRDAAASNLRNVRFLPSQPIDLLSQSLGAGDLHLVTMKEGMSGLVVPSKFYGVMAAGRPCLFVGPAKSEVAEFLTEHSSGCVLKPGDAEALTSAILSYRHDPKNCILTGERAVASVKEEDSRSLFVSLARSVMSRL